MTRIQKNKHKSSHTYTPACSDLLFLDRVGNKNEYEPKYLRKISDYYKKMGLISEQTLPLKQDVYGGIERALLSSSFHTADNTYKDTVESTFLGVKEQTDAAGAVENALQQFFRQVKIPIDVDVVSIDENSMKGADRSKLQTKDDPNRFIVSAQMAMENDGSGALLLFAVVAEDDFDSSLANPRRMVNDISATIRHELIHDRQYDSLARDMGISRLEAKKKFEDWGLIPSPSAPRDEYLGSHIEVDAFGHEFAERLAHEFGLDEAEKLASTQDLTGMRVVAREIGLADNFKEYFEQYPDEKFTDRLQRKIRKNLRLFRNKGVYEVKITRRQLRRIIKEEKAMLQEYGGRPYDPTVPGDFERYRDNPTGDAPRGVPGPDAGSIKAAREALNRALTIFERMGYDEAADHVIAALESID